MIVIMIIIVLFDLVLIIKSLFIIAVQIRLVFKNHLVKVLTAFCKLLVIFLMIHLFNLLK